MSFAYWRIRISIRASRRKPKRNKMHCQDLVKMESWKDAAKSTIASYSIRRKLRPDLASLSSFPLSAHGPVQRMEDGDVSKSLSS